MIINDIELLILTKAMQSLTSLISPNDIKDETEAYNISLACNVSQRIHSELLKSPSPSFDEMREVVNNIKVETLIRMSGENNGS